MTARREDRHERAARRAQGELGTLDQSAQERRDALDPKETDAVARWGKLIGRSLGVLFLVYLVYTLGQALL